MHASTGLRALKSRSALEQGVNKPGTGQKCTLLTRDARGTMTTSTEITKAEIRRFLTGDNPNVLSVTGEWGVGKAFLWRSVLDEVRTAKKLSLSRYSYVSLFTTSLDARVQ